MDRMEPTAPTGAPTPPAPAAPPLDPKAARAARRAAYYGVRPNTTKTATIDATADDPKPMVITYRVMNATERQTFYDLFSDASGLIRSKLAEAQRWLADRFLLAWEGYTTREGDFIPFKAAGEGEERRVDDATWDCVAIPLRADILAIILTDNAPTPAEAAGVKS